MVAAVWDGLELAVVVVVAGCWTAAVARPVPAAARNPEVAVELGRLAGLRWRRLAVAVVELDGPEPVRSAFLRAERTSRFEVGSVSKAPTGMLLADAIGRGELLMGTTASEVFSALAGSEAAAVSVGELCTHTSGLARLPRDLRSAARLAARFVLAVGLLQRSAPGSSSMDPISGVPASGPTRQSGMSWIVDRAPGGELMVWHSGATGGCSAIVALFPASRRAVAVLANISGPSGQQHIALGLVRWQSEQANRRQIGRGRQRPRRDSRSVARSRCGARQAALVRAAVTATAA